MIEFAQLSTQEKTLYFEQISSRKRLSNIIVEKDFWVCFLLYCLYSLPHAMQNYVFKGGTSLSKVFGVINRFSEDVDLYINHVIFPGAPVVHPNPSKLQKI